MDQVSVYLEPVRYFWEQFGHFAPRLILAIIVLVAGWLLAKVLRSAMVRALHLMKFNTLTEHSGINQFLSQGGVKHTAEGLIGLLMYWVVILITLLIASNVLGLSVVSELFSDMLQFVPKVIAAVLILTIGLYFARFVSDILLAYAHNVGFEDAPLIARVARYAIVAFVVVIALGQLQIRTAILEEAFLILFGGVVLAFALAFGLGGRDFAATQLEKLTQDRRSNGTGAGTSTSTGTRKKSTRKTASKKEPE
jgi:hypothetical protein